MGRFGAEGVLQFSRPRLIFQTIFETTLDFSKWRQFRQHFFAKNENLRIPSVMGQNHLVFDGGKHPWVFRRGLGRINPFYPCFIPL